MFLHEKFVCHNIQLSLQVRFLQRFPIIVNYFLKLLFRFFHLFSFLQLKQKTEEADRILTFNLNSNKYRKITSLFLEKLFLWRCNKMRRKIITIGVVHPCSLCTQRRYTTQYGHPMKTKQDKLHIVFFKHGSKS